MNVRRRSFAPTAWAATASVVGLVCVIAAPPARATGETLAINGSFTATSNGQWAQTNEVFHNEATVRSTWTISTTCANALSCTGTVISDQGWTATIYTTSNVWYVKRDVPNWEPCATAPAPPGIRCFTFTPRPPTAPWTPRRRHMSAKMRRAVPAAPAAKTCRW